MTTKEYKTLQEAAKIMLKISKKNYGVCKEYAFGCISCQVFDLACGFDSFVNFYLDEK